MAKLKTRKSNPDKPPRILIHGMEGVGKSTFGAKAGKCIFIAPEGGCDQLTNQDDGPVDEVEENVDDWAKLHKAIDKLMTFDHDFTTLCIDSADWVERLCHKKIIGSTGKSITTVSGGFGAGLRKSEALHLELIAKLSKLREAKNMAIIVTAHSHVKESKDPSMPEDYDCFEIKCHEFVSSLWREWVDAIFFIKFNTHVNSSETGNTKKARAYSDQNLTAYTVKQPAFQAKNRYGMPPELPFTLDFWNKFVEFKNNGRKPLNRGQLTDSIEEFAKKIDDEETRKKVASSVEKAGENLAMLTDILGRVKNIVNNK